MIKLTTGNPKDFPDLLFKAIEAGDPLFFYPDHNDNTPDDNVYTYIMQEDIIIVYSPYVLSRKDGKLTPTVYTSTLDDVFIISRNNDYYLSCIITETSKALEQVLKINKTRITSRAHYKHECRYICPNEIATKCKMRLKVIAEAADLERQHCSENADDSFKYFPDMIFSRYKTQLLKQTNKTQKAVEWVPTSD